MIIFDFNGTMVKDTPFHNKAWGKLGSELLGRPITGEELNRYGHGKTNRQIISSIIDDSLDDDELDKISKKKESYYREIAASDPEYKLVDGLESFLDILKESGIRMNLASASIKENIDFFYDYFDLGRWFDYDKIIYDNGKYEDKLQMYIKSIQIINGDPAKTTIFDDSLSGVDCAVKIEKLKHLIVICEESRRNMFIKSEKKIDFFINDYNDKRLIEMMGDYFD